MQPIAIDTETYPICKAPRHGDTKCSRNVCPRLVVLSECDGSETTLYKPREAVGRFIDLLEDPDAKIVGHNIAFDVCVLIRAAEEIFDEDLFSKVFEAYDQNTDFPGPKISDTMVRENLIDIATCGQYMRGGYSLDQLADRKLERDVRYEEKSGVGAWRTRYAELDPYEIDRWPKAARRYARRDARVTLDVWEAQSTPKKSALGTYVVRKNNREVVNEKFQVKAAFALQLMSVWGFRVDEDRAKSVRDEYAERFSKLEKRLKKWGIVDSSGTLKDSEKRAVFARAFAEVGIDPVETSTGKVSTGKEARYKLKRYGYTSEKFDTIVEYTRVEKYLSTYLEPLLAAPPYALCPRYNVLVESGRTSSSGPNIQNFPKRPKPNQTIDPTKIRGCFVPRRGHVYVDADWATLELRTLAQINLNLGHEPVEMAQTLQQGRDLHTDFAAQLEGISYEEAVRAIEQGDKDVKQARDTAKVANYGYPGGMGARKFITHAMDFGIELKYDESKRLRQNWLQRWGEMHLYFDHVNRLERSGGNYPLKQHSPFRNKFRWRVRNCIPRPDKSPYTAAANSYFQGAAGDGAKIAMFELVRECYSDRSSPLYGCRPNAFIHDEFLIEAPIGKEREAGRRLREIMCESMRCMTPDIPIEADVEVGQRWNETEEIDVA